MCVSGKIMERFLQYLVSRAVLYGKQMSASWQRNLKEAEDTRIYIIILMTFFDILLKICSSS